MLGLRNDSNKHHHYPISHLNHFLSLGPHSQQLLALGSGNRAHTEGMCLCWCNRLGHGSAWDRGAEDIQLLLKLKTFISENLSRVKVKGGGQTLFSQGAHFTAELYLLGFRNWQDLFLKFVFVRKPAQRLNVSVDIKYCSQWQLDF